MIPVLFPISMMNDVEFTLELVDRLSNTQWQEVDRSPENDKIELEKTDLTAKDFDLFNTWITKHVMDPYTKLRFNITNDNYYGLRVVYQNSLYACNPIFLDAKRITIKLVSVR